MTPTTSEWVEQAEVDYADALTLMRQRNHPKYDNVCYFFHQSAEKYLKARLQEADIRIAKTHDLLHLLEVCLTIEPMWETLREHVRALNRFGSDIRYPGISADKAMALEAKQASEAVRQLARESLKLD
jgi:HEPN domain-containing protein